MLGYQKEMQNNIELIGLDSEGYTIYYTIYYKG